MTKDQALKHARRRVAEVFGNTPMAGLALKVDSAIKAATASERSAVHAFGWGQLFAEHERRTEGPAKLRKGERVRSPQGEQLSLRLLGMSFAQGDDVDRRKAGHAAGAAYEAAMTHRVVETAKQRCRERGLDPYALAPGGNFQHLIGDFIDPEEIAEWRGAEAA